MLIHVHSLKVIDTWWPYKKTFELLTSCGPAKSTVVFNVKELLGCKLSQYSYQEVFFKNGNSKVAARNNTILTLRQTQKGIYTAKDL